jgi:hypothetical protein
MGVFPRADGPGREALWHWGAFSWTYATLAFFRHSAPLGYGFVRSVLRPADLPMEKREGGPGQLTDWGRELLTGESPGTVAPWVTSTSANE